MQQQIKKGSAEAQFFGEYLVFRQKYYTGEDSDDFWEEVVAEADALAKKYENEDFSEYARKVILLHLEDVETRYKQKGGELSG